MFNIDSGTIKAIDINRNSILGEASSTNQVFHKMSTSQVGKLLEIGKASITNIEMRSETLTLTNGNFTLEMTRPCPSFCYD